MDWFEVKDNLYFLGGMVLACLTFACWIYGIIILMLPAIVAMQYGIKAEPMTMGRFVISLLFLGCGTIFFFILKKMSES